MSCKPVPKVAVLPSPYKLYDQIRLLQQRGLVISDGPKAEFYGTAELLRLQLIVCSYGGSRQSCTAFIAGTQFEQILNLYVFRIVNYVCWCWMHRGVLKCHCTIQIAYH